MSKESERNIDRKIREALSGEDASLFAELDTELSIQGMLVDSFRGRKKWLVLLVFFWTLVFFVGAVYVGVLHFGCEDVNRTVMTQTVVLVLVGGVMSLKTWYWMELQKNAVARDIKRLELEIALLAKRMTKHD